MSYNKGVLLAALSCGSIAWAMEEQPNWYAAAARYARVVNKEEQSLPNKRKVADYSSKEALVQKKVKSQIARLESEIIKPMPSPNQLMFIFNNEDDKKLYKPGSKEWKLCRTRYTFASATAKCREVNKQNLLNQREIDRLKAKLE